MSFSEEKQNEDRRNSTLRWVVLALCCLSTFGDYYCIDNVGVLHNALKTQFQSKLGEKFEYYFGMLYSVYSMPNIILPFIGGILVMKYGVRSMYVVFGLFIMLGQMIFAIGCQTSSMNTMLIGRIVFGIGGESLNICQNAMIVKWFYKSQIALPLGLTISVSRLGSVLNDVVSPRMVSSDFNASPALWTGFLVCGISFLTSIALCLLDLKKDNELNESNSQVAIDGEDALASVSAVKDLGSLFWLITILCVTLYGAVLPFNYIASGFFTETYFKNYNKVDAQNHAGVYMSIPFVISAFMVPIYGILIDKYGQRAYLSFLASICGLVCFTMFYYLSPILPLIMLGLTYSMFASVIWPAISLVVNKSLVGFAYGVTTSLQNAGLAIFPLIVAAIYSSSKSYYTTMIFFIILMVVSIVFSVVLISVNASHDNIINKTSFDENETAHTDSSEENRKLVTNNCSDDKKSTSELANYDTIDKTAQKA